MTDYTVTVTYQPLSDEDEGKILTEFPGSVISHHEGSTRASVPFSAFDAVSAARIASIRVNHLWVLLGRSSDWAKGASVSVEELTD